MTTGKSRNIQAPRECLLENSTVVGVKVNPDGNALDEIEQRGASQVIPAKGTQKCACHGVGTASSLTRTPAG